MKLVTLLLEVNNTATLGPYDQPHATVRLGHSPLSGDLNLSVPKSVSSLLKLYENYINICFELRVSAPSKSLLFNTANSPLNICHA